MRKSTPPRRGRILAAGTAAIAALTTLVGCSGSSDPVADHGSATANPDATLVVGISADPTQMLPWTETSVQSLQVLSQIYATLLNTDDHDQIAPGLAGLPAITDNGGTYTFTLKPGLKFANGSALDSTDVKYTFDQIINPATKATSASYFASVASVTAPNPTTVVVHMKHPDASFPAGLTNISTAIVPSDVPVSTLTTTPDASGPYTFVSRTPNESITLQRNPNYYAGTPGTAKLQFRIIPNDQSMVSALRTGSVDLAIFDNPVTAKTATSNTVTIAKVPSLQYHVLQLRASSPLLSDVNTRLAIQCAISRQDVINSAALGAGAATGPITSPQFRSDPNDQPCPDKNEAKAKQYLAKAGKPGGFTLNLITSQGLYSSAVDEAQSIQSQLGAVGIKVNVDTLDSNTYVQRWLAGDFDAAIAANSGNADPSIMYARYFTSDGRFNKVAGYSSSTLDQLFTQGIETTDAAKRAAIYHKISQELVNNAAWVWLFTPTKYIALNTSVHGFSARTDADLSTLWNATLS
ncbi:MAG: ABC transporter substrate-binding protein [Gordonia sp. (in: high G+C Gram-positive bacteria)]